MIDIETLVFKRIAKAFDEKYPKGSRYSEPVDTPAKFPCLTIWEADNSTYDGSLDAEMVEHHANVMYEANVYANKTSGSKQECKAMIAMVDEIMLSLGFRRTTCLPTKNLDTKIYRITARYKAVVDENHRIYRR